MIRMDIEKTEERRLVGGIPAEFFDPNYNGPWELIGRSGELLICKRTASNIEISCPEDPKDLTNSKNLAFFKAEYKSGVLSLTLRSGLKPRPSSNDKHPDFFAKEFVINAIRYFEWSGKKISTFTAHWPGWSEIYSDNYTDFVSALLGQGLNLEDIKTTAGQRTYRNKVEKAIEATWTGKLMKELHFLPAKVIIDSGQFPELFVIFKRNRGSWIRRKITALFRA